jgi:hypothetical protein
MNLKDTGAGIGNGRPNDWATVKEGFRYLYQRASARKPGIVSCICAIYCKRIAARNIGSWIYIQRFLAR